MSTSYEYWANGNTKSLTSYNSSTGVKTNETQYDENGRPTVQINYGSDESVNSKTEYTYYNNGNKATELRYSEGVLRYDYAYYSNGNKKSEIDYNSDGSIYRKYKYYEDATEELYLRNNTDGTVDAFEYYYSTGYIQYYYTDSGYLYVYDDGKTKSSSTSTSYYASKTAYTDAEIKAFIAELNQI